MATITTRSGKGSPLTNNEVDANFNNLNTDKAELSGAAFTGAITTNSTIDGRDVATDGTKLDGIESGATADQTAAQIKTAYESNSDTNAFTDADHSKLDGIEASADVTDTTNVTAAGALMDSEVTNLAQVKAFDSSDYATAAQGTTADAALSKSGGAMTGAITTNSTFDGRDVATDGTKLDGIEASADVTDTANVTSAGALMDSELTSIASVKALNQGVATTDSPTFVGLNATGDLTLDVAGDITFDADGGDWRFKDAGTTIATYSNVGGSWYITSNSQDGDIVFQGNDNGSTITALTLDMSAAGAATFNAGVTMNGTVTTTAQTPSFIMYESDTTDRNTQLLQASGDFRIRTRSDDGGTNTERLRLDHATGDISFYEDTGATPKFFWDASAESLGIGGSPSKLLHLSETSDGTKLRMTLGGVCEWDFSIGNTSTLTGVGSGALELLPLNTGTANEFAIGTAGTTAPLFHLTNSQNYFAKKVGIGNDSPDRLLSLKHASQAEIGFKTGSVSNGALIYYNDSENQLLLRAQESSDSIAFQTGGTTERMRIDSIGNVGIGVTPEAWHSNAKALQVGDLGGLWIYDDNSNPEQLHLSENVYNNGEERYIQSDYASSHQQRSGVHTFKVAASGTADAVISWNSALTIDNSGNVLLGTSTTPSSSDVKQVISSSTGAFTQYSYNGGAGSVIGAPAVSQMAMYTTTGNIGSETYTERIRIDSSGRVGIGTSVAPHQKLTVTGVSASSDGVLSNGILALTTGTGVIQDTRLLFGIVDDNYAWLQAADYGVAYRNIVINPNGGNVLVGKVVSGQVLTKGVELTASGGVWSCTDTAGNSSYFANIATSGTRYLQRFYAGSANVGSINSDGTSTSYATSSDYRLKEDDVPMTGATERVKALRPINFAWKVDGSRVDGFFAHELAEVVPAAATGTKDAMRDEEYEVTAAVEEVRDEDGNITTEAVEAVMGTRNVPDYQGIDQAKLVPLLTAALQEAITKIESLTDRIAALEE